MLHSLALIFDLDGVILDSKISILKAIEAGLRENHFSPVADDKILPLIGIGIEKIYEDILPQRTSKEIILKCVQDYRIYYEQHCLEDTQVFPGVKETLSYFANKTLAVASVKPTVFSKKILKHFKLRDYFQILEGSTIGQMELKKGTIIGNVLKKLKHHSAIMIGDRAFDITGAKENGIKSIGVTYGFGNKTELKKAGADLIIEHFATLKGLIE